MSWFRRTEKGISTPTELKRETPDGLWYQCPECKNVVQTREHQQNAYTCPNCNYHDKIGSEAYFSILFDEGKYAELDKDMISGDPLHFVDTKAYPARIKATVEKTGLKDACRTAYGKINGVDFTVSCMDFGFIG
ncbi:MAG: acetyl-CoA carboxylase carboxyl transferase subunit beta, partial [Leadbetterella sp.]|nr:acetyl-CoA carboxylase carboxyl transferase subunit beta [Leadbetterella sp.]